MRRPGRAMMVSPDDARPTWAHAAAIAAFALGAVGVALAVLPYKAFDLDRFFVPKELVLHVVASLAAAALLVRATRLVLTRVDTLLGAYLVLSAASALLAPNGWLAWRALAVSLAGAAVFWSARAVARAGWREALLTILACGVWIAAVTALLQAYGLESRFISINRAPGGTLGNRNFVAHLAAIGAPALLVRTLGARTRWGAVVGGAAFVTLGAALAMSRSRAAWLALAAGIPIVFVVAVATRRHWSGTRLWPRARWVGVATAVGVLAAVFLPNRLNWKSDSPYLDSVRGVVDYRAGSGRGRLVQYRNTLRMSVSHPVFGVGAGNWPVSYPAFASPNDPSIDPDDGMTANPWPSSDWMAVLSERGWSAFACLVLVFVGLGVGGLLALSADDADEVARGLALVSTVVAAGVVGAFDALLLLPAPALLVWGLVGALAPRAHSRVVIALPPVRRLVAVSSVVLLGGVAAFRSESQAVAMALAERGNRVVTLTHAAVRDPGSYPIQMRLADLYARRGRCDGVRTHAGRAHELFPAAPAPRRLLARCGIGGKREALR